jgi:hypothetical protein
MIYFCGLNQSLLKRKDMAGTLNGSLNSDKAPRMTISTEITTANIGRLTKK